MLFADIDEIIDGTPNEKPQTNADRIRAMSDEELAEFIVRKVKDIHHQGMYEVAWPAWLKWLKQPADEERDSNATS